MIAPMKRVSLVVMDKHREASLEKLRGIGTLHLEQKNVASERLSRLLEGKAKIDGALTVLAEYAPKGKAPKQAEPAAGMLAQDIISKVAQLEKEKKTLKEKTDGLSWELSRFGSWGDFSPKDLRFLKESGTELRLYELAPSALKNVPADVPYIVLKRAKASVFVVTAGAAIPDETPLSFGEHSSGELNGFIAEAQKGIEEIDRQFSALYFSSAVLQEAKEEIDTEIEFAAASAGMGTLEDAPPDVSVSWLSGYLPVEAADQIKAAAKENGWAVSVSDPASDVNPPTLLKNNALVRLSKPLMDFLGTVPGYREYDISAPFLVFFSIFFAMIFGDAAYGLLIFVAAVALGSKFKKQSGSVPDAVKLLYVLSGATVVWGALNGSWFMIPHDALPPFLTALILPHFNNIGPPVEFPAFLQGVFAMPANVPTGAAATTWSIQFFCFTLALIHLAYGRFVRMKKILPKLSAVAQIGWFMVISSLYFVVLNLLLGVPMPEFVLPVVGGGLAIVFIFSEQNGGNFLKNIAKSFANFFGLFLGAVGCFGDIISYIRLFAIALAGSMIGEIFNSMAVPEGGLGAGGVFVLRFVAASLILLLGHGLNLALTALGVVVHGVRLNLLEFAGNTLSMEWSGYEYKPFAVKQKKQ